MGDVAPVRYLEGQPCHGGFLRDNVDDSADGAGSIHGAGASPDDFDVVDVLRGDLGKVDRAVAARVQAHAVQEHEDLVGCGTSDAHGLGLALRSIVVDHDSALLRKDAGQVSGARIGDILLRNDRHEARRFEHGRIDPGRGDHDLVQLGGLLGPGVQAGTERRAGKGHFCARKSPGRLGNPSICILTECWKRCTPAILFPRRVLVSGIVSWLPDRVPCSAFSPSSLEGNGLWVSSPLGCWPAPCCRNPRLQWRDRCGIAPHSVFLETGSSRVWYHGRRGVSITVATGACAHRLNY